MTNNKRKLRINKIDLKKKYLSSWWKKLFGWIKNNLQIISLIVTVVMVIFIAFQSCSIKEQAVSIKNQTCAIERETDLVEIQTNALVNQTAIMYRGYQMDILEKSPYLNIDVEPRPDFFRFVDEEGSGKDHTEVSFLIKYMNMGKAQAIITDVDCEIYNSINDAILDLEEYFKKNKLGNVHFPESIALGEMPFHAYGGYLPLVEKGQTIKVRVSIQVAYEDFWGNKHSYSGDYLFLLTRDEKDEPIINKIVPPVVHRK